jgi:predicted transposase YbfD/YdcC
MNTEAMECNFPRARTLLQITRHTTHKKTRKQSGLTRWFVSSRRPDQVTPEQWLADIRGHWAGVEIRNHWKKDAILYEDKTRSRNPNIVGALALLRAALLRLFHHFKPFYGSLVATLEHIRTDQSIPLNAIFRRRLA